MKLLKTTLLLIIGLLLTVSASIVPAFAQETCEGDLRAFEHSMGITCVPDGVERVVVLEWSLLEDLLALGMQPIGAAELEGYANWVDIPMELDESVVDVGTRSEPNLEVIAGLDPDLIIGVSSRMADNYDELSAIAPTIAFNPYPEDGTSHYDVMLNSFSTIADAVGKVAEGEQIIAEMEAYFDEAASALESAGMVGETFILSQGWISTEVPTFRFFTDNALAVEILARIGLENAWDAAPELYGFSTVTIEAFAAIGDTNFFYVAQDVDKEVFTETALWNSLPFVQSGQAYWLGGDVWFFGGPLSAMTLVDTILASVDITIEDTNEAALPESAVCDEGFRPVEHAMGTTCVTVDPQRIVVLDTGEIDNALALGAAVVGAPVSDINQYQEYLSDQLDGITDTGTISEPNLEVILSLEPDLIIGSKQRYEEIYDLLSAIAPTVFTESLRVPWQDNLRLHAVALDKVEEADQLLANYATHVADVQAALGEAIDDTTISIIRFRPGQVRLYLKSSFIGYILQDIGLPRPASQDMDSFSSEISLEQVQDIDADYIFITGYAQDDSDQDTFLQSQLWQTLSAVQNGRAVDVNDDTWIAGLGVQAANYVLDDLQTILVEGDETE